MRYAANESLLVSFSTREEVTASLHNANLNQQYYMKKTFIALLALAGVAGAATNLTYWGGYYNYDLLLTSSGYAPYIGNGGSRASASVITAITTQGNNEYNLIFTPNGNIEDDVPTTNPTFTLNQAIYLDRMTVGTGTDAPTSYTIDFGTNGSINTKFKADYNGGGINFGAKVKDPGGAITFNASLSDVQMTELMTTGTYFRNLLVAENNGGNGIWNLTDANSVTLTLNGLDGYKSKGIITDAKELEKLAEGEYCLYVDQGTASRLSTAALYVKAAAVPEPATATLSLLALCGLAARRRRR